MIDTSILDKPGKLTDEERAIINKHPQIGYDMLYGNPGISAATRAGVLKTKTEADIRKVFPATKYH